MEAAMIDALIAGSALLRDKWNNGLMVTPKEKFKWSSLGINKAGMKMMETFESSAGATLMGHVHIFQGGTMKSYAETMARLDHITKKLEKLESKEKDIEVDEDGQVDPVYQMYHKQYMELANIILKYQSTAVTTAKEKVAIEAKMRELQARENKGPRKVLSQTAEVAVTVAAPALQDAQKSA